MQFFMLIAKIPLNLSCDLRLDRYAHFFVNYQAHLTGHISLTEGRITKPNILLELQRETQLRRVVLISITFVSFK